MGKKVAENLARKRFAAASLAKASCQVMGGDLASRQDDRARRAMSRAPSSLAMGSREWLSDTSPQLLRKHWPLRDAGCLVHDASPQSPDRRSSPCRAFPCP